MPFSFTKLPSAIKLTKCCKSQSPYYILLYSEALQPQMTHMASKILQSLRPLPNNPQNIATGHSRHGIKTLQTS